MNQKICKHPEGCQNKEPRHCLNKGCQAQEGTVGLSSAEKDAKAYLQDRYETDYTPEHWIKTVSEYAGQQVAEKDALLKEAIKLLVEIKIDCDYGHNKTNKPFESTLKRVKEFLIKNHPQGGGE